MAWVSDPRRQCDICQAIEGSMVKRFEVAVNEVADDGTVANAIKIVRKDYCPRCKTRLDACIKTGTGPRTKGQDKTETEPANADA